jgi:hypothetical protein
MKKNITKPLVNQTSIDALKTAIQEGLNSGWVVDFDPAKHLALLKARKALNQKSDM